MEIWWTSKLNLPNKSAFQDFVTRMSKRLAAGRAQYGPPDARQRYLSRMKLEVKAYQRTGNMEHLINIANYAHLEAFAPENKKFHLDNGVESVTRGKIKL